MVRETRRFTPEEDEYLKKNLGRLTCTELARHLGRDPSSVVSRYTTLGLRTPNRTVRRFTPEEDDFIRENAGKLSLQEISDRLGRSTGSVWGRGRNKLGVFFDRKKRTARPTTTDNGYVRVPVERPKKKRRWTLEHIHVIEQAIGRRLQKGEFVHHINLDKTDNRLENLHLFGSNTEHHRAHTSIPELVAGLLERGAIYFNHTTGEYELCETSK